MPIPEGNDQITQEEIARLFPSAKADAEKNTTEKLTAESADKQDPMLQFFAYEHLPVHLRVISKPFGDLARRIVDTLPRNPERTVALRKLLEAKDCAVRAQLYK